MPQVPVALRKARAAALRTAAAERRAAWLAGLVGTTQDVLVERPGDRGHAPGFAEVRFDPAPVGSVQRMCIVRSDGEALFASPERHSAMAA